VFIGLSGRIASEPVYKEWFDKAYPHYTIEEAITLTIPDAFSKEPAPPEPKSPEPEPPKPEPVEPEKEKFCFLFWCW